MFQFLGDMGHLGLLGVALAVIAVTFYLVTRRIPKGQPFLVLSTLILVALIVVGDIVLTVRSGQATDADGLSCPTNLPASIDPLHALIIYKDDSAKGTADKIVKAISRMGPSGRIDEQQKADGSYGPQPLVKWYLSDHIPDAQRIADAIVVCGIGPAAVRSAGASGSPQDQKGVEIWVGS